MQNQLGFSGKIADFFQTAAITPLLALAIILSSIFVTIITPTEEEPQIEVTMANVMIPVPGVDSKNIEQMVAIPAEQLLSRMAGIEHIASVSQPGMAIITVQFKVGILKNEALINLYDTVHSNSDWLPPGLGVMPPLIKAKSIDDVPILSFTIFAKTLVDSGKELTRGDNLEKIANSIEIDLKRIPGTKEVYTIGGPGRIIKVQLELEKLKGLGFTVEEIQYALLSVNYRKNLGNLLLDSQAILLESGPLLRSEDEVKELMVGIRAGKPIFLKDIAAISTGARQSTKISYHGYLDKIKQKFIETPAVTIAVTKKTGENAIKIANQAEDLLLQLKDTILPSDVEVLTTRNYGATAHEKARQLIQKLLFATGTVVALVAISLGKREAVVVGAAVILTLGSTLIASRLYGFTLNRVSLFALIFAIGILVDDAIVVVENIHRHKLLSPDKDLTEIIPIAVNEIGGPTVIATLTVIAALLPMAFVTGLMGPYMKPIPINASMGMLLSLAIAFTITPWISLKLFANYHGNSINFSGWITPFIKNFFMIFLDPSVGFSNRRKLNYLIIFAVISALLLPITGVVVLKMLPFDNKSEFQVMLDLPAGTRLEKTLEALQAISLKLQELPELLNYQIYAGTTAPISFNGLVRQYYFRQEQSLGDIQVNLISKSKRDSNSHAIVTKIRPLLNDIATKYAARIKIVEVPPGPPVLAPIVLEVYGNKDLDRRFVAHKLRKILLQTPGVVDIDDSSVTGFSTKVLIIDRNKASAMGISTQAITNTLRTGLAGEDVTYVYDESKYPAAITVRLPEEQQNSLDLLLGLTIRNSQRELVSMQELVQEIDVEREQPIYHKDLLPVHYVIADTAGKIDSPLYGLFAAKEQINKVTDPVGGKILKYFIDRPKALYQSMAIKWDGEWQITYETFRDLGLAFSVGLILIYLLLVLEFSSYFTPIIVMIPIPLTIIGVMFGHAILRSKFTATSMIGMIALAGIIVRNSILLVDFIKVQIKQGLNLQNAVIQSVIVRSQPIMLTAVAAMLGGFFIISDPIFNGLAISLIFGILFATILTLLIIPIFYFAIYHSSNTTNIVVATSEQKDKNSI